MLASRLQNTQTAEIEEYLQKNNIWCSQVLDWQALMSCEAFSALDLVSESQDPSLKLLNSPLRVNGRRAPAAGCGPLLNEHHASITDEFF